MVRMAGRSASARARQGMAIATARMPSIGCSGASTTAAASAPHQVVAMTRAGKRVTRSGQGATGDDVFGLAHAEDVDELARVLKAAEVSPVVDHVQGESFAEAGYRLELIERGGVWVWGR